MGFSTIPGYVVPIGVLACGGLVCFASTPPDALHLIRMFNVDMMTVAVMQLQGLLAALGDAVRLAYAKPRS